MTCILSKQNLVKISRISGICIIIYNKVGEQGNSMKISKFVLFLEKF